MTHPTINDNKQKHSLILVHVVREVKRETMPRDPVCGVVLDENTTKFSITYEGDTYYFCCLKCKKRFKRNAAKFTK